MQPRPQEQPSQPINGNHPATPTDPPAEHQPQKAANHPVRPHLIGDSADGGE